MESIVSFLKRENADIIALQEVFSNKNSELPLQYRSYEYLKKELGYSYGIFTPAFTLTLPEGKYLTGNAILSKYPVSENGTIFYDIPFGEQGMDHETFSVTPRNLQHGILSIGQYKIHLFNTQGIWGTDDKDNDRRLKMANTITEAIQGCGHVILSGDFNVDARTKAVKKIEQYLSNVFKDKLETTFNMRIKKGGTFNCSVVDMVFLSPTFRILSQECPDIDVSDHLPQIVVLEI